MMLNLWFVRFKCAQGGETWATVPGETAEQAIEILKRQQGGIGSTGHRAYLEIKDYKLLPQEIERLGPLGLNEVLEAIKARGDPLPIYTFP